MGLVWSPRSLRNFGDAPFTPSIISELDCYTRYRTILMKIRSLRKQVIGETGRPLSVVGTTESVSDGAGGCIREQDVNESMLII